MEQQLILDWRLARGLTFTRGQVAAIAPARVPQVDYLRKKLGYSRTFTHRRNTLGLSVLTLMLLRAQEVPPKAGIDISREIVDLIDNPALPLPTLIGLTYAPPAQYWVAEDMAGLLGQVGKLDRLVTILFLPILIDHLANGLPRDYVASYAHNGQA